MFAAQRIEAIREYLTKNKSVDIGTLTIMLGVTDVTIRRDLDKLAAEGFLIKTHGGAILNENATDNSISIQIPNYAGKQRIARTLISLVDENDTVFIGGGTTCYLLRDLLQKMPDISVVTNNASLAVALGTTLKDVILVGGTLTNVNGVLEIDSDTALEYLDGIFVNKAFVSVDGIDLMAGFTVKNPQNVKLLKKVARIAKSVIVLADSQKFDKIDLYHWCGLDQVSCVVTDECNNPEYKNHFFEMDVKLLTSYSSI